MSWIPARNGQVPHGAICAGKDVQGGPIYVARSNHNGDLVPGKLVSRLNAMYVPFGGNEIHKPDYEVLCHLNIAWVHMTPHSQIPQFAYPAGRTSSGEVLYVGRVQHSNSLQVGKVHFSHRCCYIAFGGKEISYKNYDIMVIKSF